MVNSKKKKKKIPRQTWGQSEGKAEKFKDKICGVVEAKFEDLYAQGKLKKKKKQTWKQIWKTKFERNWKNRVEDKIEGRAIDKLDDKFKKISKQSWG